MSEKIHKCDIKREKGFLYFIDAKGNVVRVKSGTSQKEVICPNNGDFTREAGWMYYLDKQGDVSRTRMKSFREFAEIRKEIGEEYFLIEN